MATGPPLSGRKRSHDGLEMPPPAWPASSESTRLRYDNSPFDENMDPATNTSLNEHAIGSTHALNRVEEVGFSNIEPETRDTLSSNAKPISGDEKWADPSRSLEAMDWEGLERRYNNAMVERDKVEEDVYQEFGSLFEFFALWMQVPIVHDNQRSTKRLKTRVHWVQNSEDDLEKKRQHYGRVVEAFKNAIALLDGP